MSNFINEIKEIIKQLETNNCETAYGLLDTHLENIKDIGPYNKNTWKVEYRESVYRLGNLSSDPDYFYNINEILSKFFNLYGKREIFCFFHSEIIWNFFEQDNFYNKEILHSYIKEYPHNPEFHHTYSHYLEKNKSLEQSMFELKIAIKIERNKNFSFSYLAKINLLFGDYLKKSVNKAQSFLEEEKKYLNSNNFINNLHRMDLIIFLQRAEDRIRDHLLIEEKLELAKKDLENSIQIQQRKIIEVLGVFSAIVAFILTNINIASENLKIKDMLMLMLGMALVLLIFVISISFLFGKRYRYNSKFYFLRNLKFWSIIGLFLFLVLLLIFA